jgi:hypothetical protein
LTCDFWAKNAKNKMQTVKTKAKTTAKTTAKNNDKSKGNKSVASPFGLRSSLRQSGGQLRCWLDAGLKRVLKKGIFFAGYGEEDEVV